MGPTVFSGLLTYSVWEMKLGRLRAGLLILLVGGSSVLLGRKLLPTAGAAQLGRSASAKELQKAVLLDPANPQLHHQLGMAALGSYVGPLSFGSRSDATPAEIINSLRRATELSPKNSAYWSDLASTCDFLGDDQCAEGAFQQALKLGPMKPRLHWLAANHYIQNGRQDAALAQFRQLLVLDPSYALPTFRLSLRLLDDPRTVQEKVMPAQNGLGLKLAFIEALMEQGKAEAAFQVWTEAVASAPPFSFSQVRSYLDRLLALGRAREAQAVWQDLESRGVVPRSSEPDRSNLLYNGDFEQLPLNAGLDWHYRPTAFLALDFADPSAYHGSRCLRVDFTVGRNLEYEPIYELVPVAPDRTYLLSAFVRSNAITSDSGARLRVVDAECDGCLDVSSDGAVGTSPWHPVNLKFSTGHSTQLIRVSIWRLPARTFPMDISGTFWLDAVRLESLPSGGLESASRPALQK
jgi:tetratricopeptide (TPR) repeat protein